MGAWGTGPFDNDDAGDWIFELNEAADLGLVRRVLAAVVQSDDYLELPEGNAAVAAAAIVAASLERSNAGLPEEAAAWLEGVHEQAIPDDARLALRALDRITAEKSEAAAIWEDSPSGAGWSAVIEALRHRLARAAR